VLLSGGVGREATGLTGTAGDVSEEEISAHEESRIDIQPHSIDESIADEIASAVKSISASAASSETLRTESDVKPRQPPLLAFHSLAYMKCNAHSQTVTVPVIIERTFLNFFGRPDAVVLGMTGLFGRFRHRDWRYWYHQCRLNSRGRRQQQHCR
jgi:hypothetical protein